MARQTVSEVVARPVRSAVQGGAGWIGTEFIDAFLWDMNDRQYGILVIVLGVVFSWIQTNAENYFGKAFLRDLPDQHPPVVDNDPNKEGDS